MGDFSHYFDIVLFAMIAAFLVLRLRSVLGRRTGTERRRDPIVGGVERAGNPAPDKVISLPRRPGAAAVPTPPGLAPGSVGAGIARIRAADPDFDADHFIQGARAAFEMIVTAFAQGDKHRLRPLLSDEVFTQFTAAIDERQAAGETLETRIVKLDTADIVQATVVGSTAQVTVKLVSLQNNVLRAHDGSIVDGHPDHPVEKTDFWTFARDTRSTDPNWALIATSSG
jgi:predicted lipid-binding transport protein (Tim44 family)